MGCASMGAITKALCNRKTGTQVTQAWIAEMDTVANIPDPLNHVISGDITFNNDDHFYSIGIDKQNSSYNYASQGEGEAKEYLNTVVLRVTGVHEEVSKIVSSWIRGEFLLIVRDKNMKQHLIGAELDGAECGVLVQNNPNAYTLTFTWTSPELPYFYTGAITTE